MNRLVVRQHDPRRMLAIAAVAGLCAWGLFEYGRFKAEHDYGTAVSEAETLQDEAEQLNARIAGLREQNAIHERSLQIERQAFKELETTVAGLQGEISELKSELAFYRGIVAPEETAEGLRIQDFSVAPNGVERGFRYKLVLTQVLKNDTVVRGTAKVSVEGTYNGKLRVFDFGELASEGSSSLNFRFRYFQNFEGDLVLPEGFNPARVLVKVDPRGRRYRTLDKVYDWPAPAEES